MSDCSPDNSVDLLRNLPSFTDRAIKIITEAGGDRDSWSKYDHAVIDLAREADAALTSSAQSTVPDAWQFRFKRWNGEWSDWQTLHGGDEGYRNPDYEYRPLFASPVSSTHRGVQPCDPNDPRPIWEQGRGK